MRSHIIDPRFSDLEYSVRRYYVDDFCSRCVAALSGKVLDLGGKKVRKRGQFDISCCAHLSVTYVNIERTTEPDVCCDVAELPLVDNSFDGIICVELLEHVFDPVRVLKEIYRVLRLGGRLLITVPFLFPMHADPYDYGRYTDHYWREVLEGIGFYNIHIEYQGFFWSVLADSAKQYGNKKGVLRPGRWILVRIIALFERWAFRAEAKLAGDDDSFYHRYTTGFGIVCQK